MRIQWADRALPRGFEKRARKEGVTEFLNESSANSPVSGLYSDWPKNNRALKPRSAIGYRIDTIRS